MANPPKRMLAQLETKYLDFQVVQGQIFPLEDKVRALKSYECSKTKRQVHSFLGLINYYHKFILCVSEITGPD